MVEKENFDVVLMDIQMPIMNGFETAKAIRATGNLIPIIALTAAAIKGEREKCVQSGMNDYITKPFKEEDLLKLIDKCMEGETSAPVIITSKAAPEPEPEALYDLSMLREISRGNDGFVAKMIDVFCDQTPQLVDDMMTAYNENNFEQMGNLAHKIKPSIDNLKINTLTQIIRDIELMGRENQPNEKLPALLDQTRLILLNVTQKMKMETSA